MPGGTPDRERDFDRDYLDRLHKQIQSSLDDIAQYFVDQTNRVDEYQAQGYAGTPGESQTTAQVLPDYECDEIITGVIVTGTPAGTFTLQLGRRNWPLVMPASGILVIAPIQIKLGRSDTRNLTAAAAGNWEFELMGYAETGRRGRV